MTDNSLNNDSKITISIKDVTLAILSHIKLIITTSIICVLISITLGLVLPSHYTFEKRIFFNTFSDFSIPNHYGINSMTISSFENTFQKNLNDYFDINKTPSTANWKKTITTEKNNNQLIIKVNKVRNIEEYEEIINKLLQDTTELMTNTILNATDITIKQLQQNRTEQLDYLCDNNFYSDIPSIINNLNDKINILESYKTSVENPFTQTTLIKKHNSLFLSIKGLLLSTIAGICISLIYIILNRIFDNHIYNSEYLLNFINDSEFNSVLPYSSNKSNLDPYFQYIAHKIPNHIKTINIISLTKGAGKSLIANGLKKALSTRNIIINEFETGKWPNTTGQDDNYTLIIIKSGKDISSQITMTAIDYRLLNNNFAFILNYALKNDKFLINCISNENLVYNHFTPLSKFYNHLYSNIEEK